MGMYNILKMIYKCPICGQESLTQIDLYFGYLGLDEYKIGDKIQWKDGRRPDHGDLDGEGYAECDICHRDYFIKAIVRNDILIDIIFDPQKEGYIK